MDPIAQGIPDAPLPTQDQGISATPPITPETPPAPDHSAVQKRIDELTARSKDYERQNAELNARAQEQSQMLAAILTQRQEAQVPVQKAPELPEGMDPATAQYMQQMFERSLDQRMRPLMAQLGQVQGVSAAQQAAAAASQYGAQVQQRAAALAQNWQAKGLTGFTPEDAAIYAAGEAFRAQHQAAAAQQASRQGAQGFAAGMDMPGARGAPGVSGGVADAPVPEWADYNSDSYNPTKGQAFWEARARASMKR